MNRKTGNARHDAPQRLSMKKEMSSGGHWYEEDERSGRGVRKAEGKRARESGNGNETRTGKVSEDHKKTDKLATGRM